MFKSPGSESFALELVTLFSLVAPWLEHGNSIKIWQSIKKELPELKRQLLVSPPGSEKSWFMGHRASSQREVKEKLNHKDRDCTDWADLLGQ